MNKKQYRNRLYAEKQAALRAEEERKAKEALMKEQLEKEEKQVTTTQGSSIPYLDESVDGWQAYCAGMGLKDNPCKRRSEAYQKWKEGFLQAKHADKEGVLGNDVKELPIKQYFERHPEKRPSDEQTESKEKHSSG